ncbi:MAG: HAMP domain-containing histidine kinase [Ferruginibacter sp.]|nr:HAMP domain-containing histidine kinase [Ferruginibacter sp.]
MKRVFPIITILILLSLLGLIFFQFLWLKSAKEIKEQQLDDNIARAISDAAEKLVQEKTTFPFSKKPDVRLGDKMKMEFFKPSVIQRFSRDDIQEILQASFTKNLLKDIPFEFAVTENTLTGDQVATDNFLKYYLDSPSNIRRIIQLIPPTGSNLENLTRDELLVVIVPHSRTIILKEITWFIMGAILFTIIITTAFFLTIRTLLKQKKLSEIKSDFINNMTHEFKTPLATISLAVDALKNEKVSGDKEKTNYFTGIIKEENKRMNKQVETILQAALLDRQEVQLNLKKVSANSLIKSALNNIALPIEDRGGKIEINLEAQKDIIMADEVHFTNIINNLLDNAVKYSKENPHIKLHTSNQGNSLRIKIEDNGIGMNKETLSRIFEKFYRAHTGNIHNVKGFGLGLSYVKTMVDAHHGQIKPESTLGKGSCFIITMPLAK